MKNSVFISYSRRDKPFVQRLVKAFNDLGRDVWIDWEDIPPVADWRNEIHSGIDNADDFVFIISPDSVESEVCGEELSRAIQLNKRLVPLLYREVNSYKAIHDSLSAHNWIFFNDEAQFDEKFQQLLTALDTDLEHTRAHTRLLTQALEWDKKGKNTSSVLRGQDLQDAERWYAQAADKSPRPTELQSAYIYASRQAAESRRRFAVGALVVGLGISIALSVFAVMQSIRAQNASAAAALSQQYAEQQEANALSLLLADKAQQSYREREVELAIALALESNLIGDPPAQSQLTLSEVAYSPGVRKFYEGHKTSVNSVAVSADNRTALTGSFDGTSVYWDMETGEELTRFVTSDRMPIRSVTFSPTDSGVAFAGLWDWSIVMWDTSTGEEIQRFGGIRTGVGHHGVVNSIVISRDGKFLLSGSNDGTLLLWDLETSEIVRQYGSYNPLDGNGNAVFSVDISTDGKYAVSGRLDGTVQLWNIETGELLHTMDGHGKQAVLTVAYSPNGETVVSGSRDHRLALWSVRTGRKLVEFTANNLNVGHVLPVRSVAYSPDNATIISAAEDGSIIVWDIDSGDELRYLGGIDRSIQELSVAVTHDGRRVLAGSSNGRLTIWDITNEAVENYYEGHLDYVNSVDLSPDGQHAVTASSDSSLIIWDVVTSEILYTLEGHTQAVNRALYSPDGANIASGGDDGHILIWDTASNEISATREIEIGGPISDMKYTRDGQQLVVATYDGRLLSVNVTDGQTSHEYEGHARRVLTIAISPDGQTMATGAADGSIFVWEIETGEQVQRYTHHPDKDSSGVSRILSLDYSPDGQMLLFGSLDGELSLWKLATNEIAVLEQAGRGIWSVDFSPDGKFAVSGLADGTLTLWDIEQASALRRFREHRLTIMDVVFNAEGNRVLTASRDATALLWDMPTLDTLLNWTHANRYVLTLTCEQRMQYRLESPDCTEVLTGMAETFAANESPKGNTVALTSP